MTEPPGHLNIQPLLDECAEAVFANWQMPTRVVAKAVIDVLRRRGLLNEAGIALCRAEIGDRK